MKSLWTIIILLHILCVFQECRSEHSCLEKRRYCFDAGQARDSVIPHAASLETTDLYSAESGFGWIVPPEEAFVRPDLERSRSALTIDGVRGRELCFKADLESGLWWITMWIDAGHEDSSTVTIEVNGERRKPEWQSFRPPAEGRNRPQSIYRVYHGCVEVCNEGMTCRLNGGRGHVSLLGFSMTPDAGLANMEQQNIEKRLKSAGVYGSDIYLEEICTDLERMSDLQPGDIFAAYWLEQVQLMQLAEEYIQMMGWEWAKEETGLGIFDRYHQAVMILDGLLDRPEPENYYLYERALWFRGKVLYWLGKERHGVHEIEGARRDLARLFQRYPEDELLAMYNGGKVDQPDCCDSLDYSDGAPQWSVAQREALCRMREIVDWWVHERQAPNGEFGGKLDDDVEILRWWTTLILAGDSTAYNGWRLLADCVWNSPQLYAGYSRRVRDVEHASEFISDTAPAMILYTDDPDYLERLLPSVHHFDTLWTGMSLNGRRLFRSSWFSSQEVVSEPPKNRDHEYNTRAVKAVRYYAWKSGDPDAARLLHEWSLTWLQAAESMDKGKPAGIIPASIRYPDEAINGEETDWFRAGMYWDYFDWEHHAGSMMLDQMLFTYTLTDDTTLLQPIVSALDLIESFESLHSDADIPGTSAWAARVLRGNKSFWNIVAQWRLLTGISGYDDLLAQYGPLYLRYRLTGDARFLVEGLDSLLENIRYNTPLLTSEVLHTDRVYVRGAHHLKAMITGDGIPESMSPYCAVSWEGTNEDFTALVSDAGTDRLEVQIFSHAEKSQAIQMRLWQLLPGRYRMVIESGSGTTKDILDVHTKGQRVAVEIIGGALLAIRIDRLNE